MITIDGIIYSLQRNGGITVCFNELISRARARRLPWSVLRYQPAENQPQQQDIKIIECERRLLERYRDCVTPQGTKLLHSSYYRLPADRRIPAITTVHDFTYEKFVSGPRKIVHSWQKFKAIRGAEIVICISQNTKADLLNFLPEISSDRIRVIPNGVSETFFPIPRSGSDKSSSEPFVVFVGARGGYKNFDKAVKALSQLPDIALKCVGGGPFTEDETTLLNKYLKGRFGHAGYITESELNRLYNDALALVYPSSYEGFGIPVLEAMRAGCPVVAVNCSSIPEVAGDAAVLVAAHDPDALSGAIDSCCNEGKRQELRRKGFDQAATFSWDSTFDQTLTVYEEVIGPILPDPAVGRKN